jgi:hypothetical protein
MSGLSRAWSRGGIREGFTKEGAASQIRSYFYEKHPYFINTIVTMNSNSSI